MSEDARIDQFRRITQADPGDMLAHFSLGMAYLAAGHFQEAVAPLVRVLELDPDMSKAYELLGKAYARAGQRERAISVLTQGVQVAERTGDRIPRDAMAGMLAAWGVPVPDAPASTLSQARTKDVAPSSDFECSRCRQRMGRLERAPFKGPLGQQVFEQVCSTCWREWITMGTRVINELGLILSTPEGQEAYDQQMIEFLQLGDR